MCATTRIMTFDLNPNDAPPILIAGPTASGKSQLAARLAERVGGRIINVDSMQVYRELRILTARPSEAEEALLPHALYGFVPASEAYSAGRFIHDVTAALIEARAAGQRPILVGGTGLYFKALLEGLSPTPPVPDDIRQRWRMREKAEGASSLHSELQRLDPVMASRLEPNDGQRIVRALEVYEATGRSLAEWQTTPGVPVIRVAAAVKLLMMPSRSELRARVDARFEAMMDMGALDEVRALAELKLSADLPAMRAIGVKPLMQLIAGDVERDVAVEAAKAETRQYLKRQTTWIASHFNSWNDVGSQSMESSVANSIAFI